MRCLSWFACALMLLPLSRPFVAAQGQAAKPYLQVQDALSEDDPLDKLLKKSRHKVHELKMEAGKAYRIDLTSADFDTFLRLESPEGKHLAHDDDGGGGTDARLIHKAAADGTYRIIASSFLPAKTGKYEIVVREPDARDLLGLRVRGLMTASKEEKRKTLEDFLALLEEQGKKIDIAQAQQAIEVTMALDDFRPAEGAKWANRLGEALAVADDQRVSGLSKMFVGIGRRLGLPGNTMDIKGTRLDGKPLDWASYRGKVVLVDFWATWCGPCVAEVPRMKKLYEQYHARGFDIVGISCDRNIEAPTAFMMKRELPWACIHEKDEPTQPLPEYYGAISIPQAILVDREGKVVSLNARGPELDRLLEKHIGPADEK